MNDHLCTSLCLNIQLWVQREVSQNSEGIHNEAAPCRSALYSFRNCDNNFKRHQCSYWSMKCWREKKNNKNNKTPFSLKGVTLQEKVEWPSKVLLMKTPYVFLCGFMNFQDDTFPIKVIYSTFFLFIRIQSLFITCSFPNLHYWRNSPYRGLCYPQHNLNVGKSSTKKARHNSFVKAKFPIIPFNL